MPASSLMTIHTACRHTQAYAPGALDFARHPREQQRSQARVRPHTALPTIHSGHISDAMHMPVIPER